VETGKVPAISIYAERRGESVRLWFQDNGIGIAEEFHPRLFHIFQRGSERYPGTGLGLALAKRVVERMDGKIGVETAPDRGSRF
jgi:signal transduction histidine kinase